MPRRFVRASAHALLYVFSQKPIRLYICVYILLFVYIDICVYVLFCTLLFSSFWTSRGNRCVVPSPPRFLPSIFIAHRVQQSHCSSIVHRVLLTHALALSASQFVHKKKSPRIYTSMHSAGLELTKLTYTRLEDNLIRHRGDQIYSSAVPVVKACWSTFMRANKFYFNFFKISPA